jgi:Ni/Co efflux regulator RcnB
MKTPLMARAAALVLALAAAAAPMAATAATADQNRPQQQQPHRDNDRRDNDRHDNDRNDRNSDRYGRWQSNWGARPPAPPRSFTRVADWHRHVRACQQRYRSYNPSTDRYVVRRGETAVCRL